MDDVGSYYDRTTRSFLRFGRGSGSTGAIHRAIWAPGVTAQEDALDYVHKRMVAALVAYDCSGPDASLLDLGCGVGGSVLRMHQITGGARVAGLTLSSWQAEEAGRRIASAGVGERVQVRQGDFTEPQHIAHAAGPRPVDGVWMIEAYNHGSNMAGLLAGIRNVLRPGGVLILVDDMPEPRLLDGPLSRREQFWRREFFEGWHVHTRRTPARLDRECAIHGLELVEEEDWTDATAINRPRDYLVRLVAGPAAVVGLRRGSWDNIRGGNALQQLTRRSLVRYRMRVYRRT